MTINDEHWLMLFIVSLIFFVMGSIVGCGAGSFHSKEQFKQGQQSCKVCEVIKNEK